MFSTIAGYWKTRLRINLDARYFATALHQLYVWLSRFDKRNCYGGNPGSEDTCTHVTWHLCVHVTVRVTKSKVTLALGGLSWVLSWYWLERHTVISAACLNITPSDKQKTPAIKSLPYMCRCCANFQICQHLCLSFPHPGCLFVSIISHPQRIFVIN